MNFIAHAVIAQSVPISRFPSLYLAGCALPDLLPLAAPHARLRAAMLTQEEHFPEDAAIKAGAWMHLTTDAAFHKAPAFLRASAEASALTAQAGFTDMRVRKFFLAHILVELALDAFLIRNDPSLLDGFYAQFAAADLARVTHWSERTTKQGLPHLPEVLQKFGQSQYLRRYRTDAGVAEGIHRLCLRAQQEGFAGINTERLIRLTARVVATMRVYGPEMLAETAALAQPPITGSKS